MPRKTVIAKREAHGIFFSDRQGIGTGSMPVRRDGGAGVTGGGQIKNIGYFESRQIGMDHQQILGSVGFCCFAKFNVQATSVIVDPAGSPARQRRFGEQGYFGNRRHGAQDGGDVVKHVFGETVALRGAEAAGEACFALSWRF